MCVAMRKCIARSPIATKNVSSVAEVQILRDSWMANSKQYSLQIENRGRYAILISSLKLQVELFRFRVMETTIMTISYRPSKRCISCFPRVFRSDGMAV